MKLLSEHRRGFKHGKQPELDFISLLKDIIDANNTVPYSWSVVWESQQITITSKSHHKMQLCGKPHSYLCFLNFLSS